jgi:hypothetical protein
MHSNTIAASGRINIVYHKHIQDSEKYMRSRLDSPVHNNICVGTRQDVPYIRSGCGALACGECHEQSILRHCSGVFIFGVIIRLGWNTPRIT